METLREKCVRYVALNVKNVKIKERIKYVLPEEVINDVITKLLGMERLDDESLQILVSAETRRIYLYKCWKSIHNSSLNYISNTCGESLTSLTMSHCPLVDDSAIQMISSCKGLSSLSLDCAWNVSDEGLRPIINQCKLNSFRLSNLPKVTLDWGSEFWLNCTQLQVLHIIGCVQIHASFIEKVPETISSLSIQTLQIVTRSKEPVTNFESFAHKIKNTVEYINFDGTEMNSIFIRSSVFRTSGIPYFNKLKVVRCSIDDIPLLSEHCPLIEVLSITSTTLRPGIAEYFKSFTRIHTLLLHTNSDDTLEILNAVKDTLQYLSIGLKDKTGMDLPHLKYIDLSFVSISYRSFMYKIYDVFGHKVELTSVYEQGPDITDQWMIKLALANNLALDKPKKLYDIIGPNIMSLLKRPDLRVSFGSRVNLEDFGYFPPF